VETNAERYPELSPRTKAVSFGRCKIRTTPRENADIERTREINFSILSRHSLPFSLSLSLSLSLSRSLVDLSTYAFCASVIANRLHFDIIERVASFGVSGVQMRVDDGFTLFGKRLQYGHPAIFC